jgi:hypothetical protein
MDINKRGKTPIYDNKLKIVVAREYLTGNLGYGALAKKYSIEQRTVRHFVFWYRKHYSEQQVDIQPKTLTNPISQTEQDVFHQLKEANLKIAALELLIETAQKELGIDIAKKPGTKQSMK